LCFLLLVTFCLRYSMAPTRPKASGVARQLSADAGTERHGSVWNLASPPASCRSEIAGSHLTITQMVVDGKGLQEEAFRARQEAGISQGVAAITEQLPRQADDGWIEVVSTATGAGTSGMLVGATPNASRAAAGTPHNIVNAPFPQQIESFRACGQGLRVDFDASDSDEDIGDEKSDAVCDMAREWFLDIVGHHNSEAERRSSRRAQDLSVTHHISQGGEHKRARWRAAAAQSGARHQIRVARGSGAHNITARTRVAKHEHQRMTSAKMT